ncbi:glycine betaine ABC transporter substrate-binding protein [Pelagibacterium mangrovi]|uniref:glycine betaine ABC transporter substrate-binding protein n=1 Tax=Pelagibacterium mangrovi TaxID=3119828 RepID=UPI002FC5F359
MRIDAAYVLVIAAVLAATPALAQFEVLDPVGAEDEAPSAVEAAEQSPCGAQEITIAEMGWPSAAILANIHATILRVEFNCTVRLVPGEPEATLSSMATTQQPAVAPELWVSRQADVWNGAMQAASARAAAPTFADGPLEAWFVPSYVKANNNGLVGTADIMDHWQVFLAEGEEKAKLMSCPADWACSVINRNMAAGLGLDERFDVVEPEDRFAMDAALTDAVSRREPVLAYYWQPNALIDRLDLVPLDMGGFDPGNAQCMAIRDCVPFGGSGFAPDTVVIATAEWVFADAPDVADYLARASMPIAEMNRLLAWQIEQEATAEAVAQHFLIASRDIWQVWIGADEADDIVE